VIVTFATTIARQIARRARPTSAIGALVLVGWAVLAALAPLAGYPVGADVDPSVASAGPSAAHWLGTDHLGRDVFWRLLLGARAFVGPGLLACAVSAGVGIPLGAWTGWSEGVVSAALRTGLGAISSVPRLVLVLLACSIYGNGALQLALAVGVAGVPPLAEAIRERVVRMRVEEFVLASRAHGLSDAWVLLVHLVMVASGRAVARQLLAGFGAFLGVECTLSYLGGFGVQEPTPSWGNMLAAEWGRAIGWSTVAPALAIALTLGATSAASQLFAEVDDG
jgi:peptide/nickel transport system permease protein